MKVLLFSNDLMPFGNLPTSGGGLRCWQIYQGLSAHGVEVLASMPGFTYLAEKHFSDIPERERGLLWYWGKQDEILAREKPDAVIYASNWDHYNLARKPDVPLIIDLHGSRLIETTMFGDPVDTDRKVSILALADCLLTAGQRQRLYFSGWLLQAGRVPTDDHFIRYIPISLAAEKLEHLHPEPDNQDAPVFVSGGGWFPWQNQSNAIFAICREIVARDKGSIHIFGTPHDTKNISAEERKIREIYEDIKRLAAESPRINVHGYVGRDDLIEIYRKASVAVEAMEYNLERELAFTTRTIEYLWCGLPVLYNDYSEISTHIAEYDAGWTVDPTNQDAIKSTLDEIFSRPDLLRAKSDNAQRLVDDRFRWDRTILPLLDFLKNPSRAESVIPTLRTPAVHASFLSPHGRTAEVKLAAGSVLHQRFLIPAESITSVEIPISVRAQAGVGGSDAAELIVMLRDSRGKTVSEKRLKSSQVPADGRLRISFPWWHRPKGGVAYELLLKRGTKSPAVEVTLRALLEERYPFLAQVSDSSAPSDSKADGRGLIAQSVLGGEIKAASLQLSFIPGGARLYRWQSIFKRVYWLIRNGEWSRLWRAVVRRAPELAPRLLRLR